MEHLSDAEFDVAELRPHGFAPGAFTYSNDPKPAENLNISLNVTVGPDSPLHSSKHHRVNGTTNRYAIEMMRQLVYQYDMRTCNAADPDEIREYLEAKIPTRPNQHAVHSFNIQRLTSRKPVPHIVVQTADYTPATPYGMHVMYHHLAASGVKVTARSVEFAVTGEYGLQTTTQSATSIIDNKLVLDKDVETNPYTDPLTGNVYVVTQQSPSESPASDVSFVLS